ELLRRRLVALTEADLVTVRAWRQFHAVVRLRGDAGAVGTLHDVARVVPHDDLTAVRPDRRLTSDLHVRNEVAGRQGMNGQLHIRCDVHLDARLLALRLSPVRQTRHTRQPLCRDLEDTGDPSDGGLPLLEDPLADRVR